MSGNTVVKQETSETAINSRHQTEENLPEDATNKPPSFEDVYQAIMLQKVSPVFELHTRDARRGEIVGNLSQIAHLFSRLVGAWHAVLTFLPRPIPTPTVKHFTPATLDSLQRCGARSKHSV